MLPGEDITFTNDTLNETMVVQEKKWILVNFEF